MNDYGDASMTAEEIAGLLSQLTGSKVTPAYGGFRIRETQTHYIDAVSMIVNWRVTETRKDDPRCYDRHWCFNGTSVVTLVRVIKAVMEWDCANDTDPPGWNKNGQTGEWRPETHGPQRMESHR